MPSSANPRARLARASFWTMAGAGVHLGAGMLTSIIAARILGPAHFGELAILRTTLLTFTLAAGANLAIATSRATAALRIGDPARAGHVLGVLFDLGLIVSGLAAAICLALAAPIARQLGAPQLTILVAALAPAILTASMSAVQVGTLNGFEAFAIAGRLLAAEGILTGALLVLGSAIDGVRGGVAGLLVATGVAYLLRRRALGTICRENGVVIKRQTRILAELPLIRSLVIPSALFGLGTQPFAWLARALLARGTYGLAEVGIFSAAYSWGAAVLTVSAQVTRPAMPILTNLLAHDDAPAFKRLLRDTLLLAFGTSLLVALPMMALSPWIMRAYGARFTPGTLVLCVVAASSILASLSAALRSALVATGEVWGQVAQSLLWGCTLIATFYLARRAGAMALAIAYTVAFAATLLAQAWSAVIALKSGKRTRSAVDLSAPVLAEVNVLESDPEA